MSGQINLQTEFGKKLCEMAMNPSLKTFVEVGAWNGQGSTLCLAKGLQTRPDLSDVRLFSLETNKQFFEIAENFWKDKGLPVHILNARVAENMMPLLEIVNHPRFDMIKNHWLLHYEQDIVDFYSSAVIKMLKADMILLDGGEFSTYSDWLVLKELNPSIVALDDTNVMKSERVLKELKEAGWTVLFESNERNGCAILQNPQTQ
jgi:hypothetical protein